MATPQDIFAALDRLDKGVTDFATVRAINEANDMVRSIQTDYQDEAQKIEALRNVSSGLTRQLAGLGVDAARIKEVAGSFAPPDAPTIQTAFQATIAGLNPRIPEQAAQIRKLGQKNIDDTNIVKQLSAGQKQDSQVGKEYQKALNEFGSPNYARKLKEGWEALMQKPDEITNNLQYQTAIRGIVRQAEGGSRVSNEDVLAMVPDTSAAAKVARAYNSFVEGRPFNQEDASIIQDLFKVAKIKASEAIQKRVKGYAKVKSRAYGQEPAQTEADLLQLHFPELLGNMQKPAVAPLQQPQSAQSLPGVKMYKR